MNQMYHKFRKNNKIYIIIIIIIIILVQNTYISIIIINIIIINNIIFSITIYISSFIDYFGTNIYELGHGGKGSIYKINDKYVIKSYCASSLGLYRELFALKYILNKKIFELWWWW